ncbi:MAG TPA: PHP domain-containing protein [Candidatus Kryptonia bacterium]
MRIDLHTHTNSSDGALSVSELFRKVKNAAIDTLSVTDHDTVSALDESTKAASELGIEFVPGIEVTSRYKSFQLHFLGYFIDYTNKNFLARLRELQDARIMRAKRIIAKLNKIKIPLKLESVIEKAGLTNSIGRPHIANSMVEEGFAESYDEVFNKYIGIGRPAYEANYQFPPERAIALISEAGGLAVLAHPSHYVSKDFLIRLLKLGMEGVEVIHPSHSDEERAFYSKFADENSILKTGGSDFHGGLKNDDVNLGKYIVNESWFSAMKEKVGRSVLS